jgi:hypothetical protein
MPGAVECVRVRTPESRPQEPQEADLGDDLNLPVLASSANQASNSSVVAIGHMPRI